MIYNLNLGKRKQKFIDLNIDKSLIDFYNRGYLKVDELKHGWEFIIDL